MEFKWTENLASQTYKDALNIRKTVFVVEQNVPIDLEVDELENQTIHVVGYLEGKPCVTARMYEKETGVFKIQRVAVSKDFRKRGLGYELMEEVERKVTELDGNKLVLGAQNTAIPFYEKLDYKVYGNEFMDAGIPHHQMEKFI